MGRRMVIFHRCVRIIPLSFAVAGGGYLLFGNPPGSFVEFSVTVLVLVAIVLDYALDFGKKASVMHVIGLECKRIQNAYHDLWEQVNDSNPEEQEIRQENRKLADLLTEVAGWAGFVDLYEGSKLNDKCRKAALVELGECYLGRKEYVKEAGN